MRKRERERIVIGWRKRRKVFVIFVNWKIWFPEEPNELKMKKTREKRKEGERIRETLWHRGRYSEREPDSQR